MAIGGVAAFAAALLVGASLVDLERDPPPASSEALARVAAKNKDAAIVAAARMRAASEASTRAADARLRAAGAGESSRP